MRRPDLDIHRVLLRPGNRFRRPVVDGVEDHAAVGRFLADGLCRSMDQAREFVCQLHGSPLRVPDALGKTVGIHMNAGKAELNGAAEFLNDMLRPAAGGGDVHIVEPPGKRHRLGVHGVHAPFRMRLKGVLCRGIDRAVGQRPDAAGLAGFYLPCDDAQIRWAPHRIVVPFTRRKKPVVPVHPVVKLHRIEMQIAHPLHVRRVRVERGEVRQKSVADLRAAVGNDIERAFPDADRGADAHAVAAGRHIRQDQCAVLPNGMERNLTLHAEERHRHKCRIIR